MLALLRVVPVLEPVLVLAQVWLTFVGLLVQEPGQPQALARQPVVGSTLSPQPYRACFPLHPAWLLAVGHCPAGSRCPGCPSVTQSYLLSVPPSERGGSRVRVRL
jgi:hypothetical protein